MQPRGEGERTIDNRPPGKCARQFVYVFLRITGAKGMQFEQLAGVVLVRIAFMTIRIVEIGEHRRAVRAGCKQIAKAAQCMRAKGLVLLRFRLGTAVPTEIGIEMVLPEPDHHLVQLTATRNHAQQGTVSKVRQRYGRQIV